MSGFVSVPPTLAEGTPMGADHLLHEPFDIRLEGREGTSSGI